ncbi:hypothetical protein [Microbacterium foliorum]|uniref:hypothetical protein n=1 Tax=Microbacterium foliorum TaxID=104336 RepID=UPI0009A077BE|nr:hypothetical protein [Microbacterium foliorum]AQY00237.1 hypothetical protein B2G67_01100 [Microbacterium foliorum]
MAVITRFFRDKRSARRASKTTECAYQVVVGDDGDTYLQLVTFGSDERQDVGTGSQNIRMNEKMARQLTEIIAEAFPAIRSSDVDGD